MSPAPDLRTTCRTTGAVSGTTRLLSTLFPLPVLGRGAAPDAILLKKKRASYAIARLSSFEGTDKPRASCMAQSGGAS